MSAVPHPSLAFTPPVTVSAWRQAALRQALLSLGADADSARKFANSGTIDLGGAFLHMVVDQAHGSWTGCLKFGRPDDIDQDTWTLALMTANAQTLMLDDWAVGLEDDGDAVILMNLPAGLDDPRVLSTRFAGMLELSRALVAGARMGSTGGGS